MVDDSVADRMQALVVARNGGPEVLEVRSIPVPRPKADQVLIEVAAAGVNFIDVYQREGIYPIPTPFVLGGEGAGRVVAVGDGVTGVDVGARVATADATGAMSGYAAVAADQVVPIPDGVPADIASAAMLQGMTAHYLVNSTYSVQAGDEVLIHAAAGGVGQLVVPPADPYRRSTPSGSTPAARCSSLGQR
jgi:NADPH2:quinone reductase